MKKKKQLLGLVAAAAALSLTLAGCSGGDTGSAGSGASADSRERVSLNVGYIDTSINGVGITAIADDQDLWDAAGIDVTLTPFTNGPTQIQAMAANSIDVGYIGGGATWLPASGQATIIAPSESTFGDYLIASPQSGATSVKDLKGLRVGVPDGGSGEMILSLALEKAGLTADDIERVPLDPPNVVSAFVSGQIDVAAIFSPLSNQITESVPDAVVIANNKDFPETEFVGAWVASNDAVANKSEAVIRFLEVYAQANDFRVENPEEAVKLASEASGAPEAQLQGQADALDWWTSKQILADDKSGVTAQRFEALEKLFVKIGRLKEVAPADTFVNVELFEKAMENLGS